MTAPLWRLRARPEELLRAASGWHAVAEAAQASARRFDRAAQGLLAEWSGDAADAYEAHRGQASAAFATLSTVASTAAGVLERAARTVETGQHHLDDAWDATRQAVGRAGPGLRLAAGADTADAFAAINRAQAQLVSTAEVEAEELRGEVEAALATLAAALRRLPDALSAHAALLDGARYTYAKWVDLPESSVAGAVIVEGDTMIINAGPGKDVVTVGRDPATGERVVVVDGVAHSVPAGLRLVVRGGPGDDLLRADPHDAAAVTLVGGDGNDTLQAGGAGVGLFGLWGNDTLLGGAGTDYLSGGADTDYLEGRAGADLLLGGEAADTLYGLGGNDNLFGGEGADYLDGGTGNDTVNGGADDDVVAGGDGDDHLDGGAGDDVAYSGAGADDVHGGDGVDRAYLAGPDPTTGVERSSEVIVATGTDFVSIDGSADFAARVRSDLAVLAASPTGQAMFTALSNGDEARPMGDWFGGESVVITETTDANGYTYGSTVPVGPAKIRIEYNPAFDTLQGGAPPVSVLYHELAHAYDYTYGTLARGIYTGADNPGVPNDEREAVGLPIDADHDPSTPDTLDPDHPYVVTENGLRDEMGIPDRLYY